MTSDSSPDLAAAVERLSGLVQSLSERLDVTQEMQAALASTMEQVKQQQAVQTSQRRTNRLLAISITFNVVLSIVVVAALFRIYDNAQAIRDVQDRTSNTVLCPLFGLLVAQIDSAPAAAVDENEDGTVTPDEQADWDNTVRVIRDGFAALDCHPIT